MTTVGVLFDGAFEPFTSCVWFIEAPYEPTVDAVRRWLDGLPGPFRYDDLTGPLEAALTRLEPWAMPSWKQLVVATRGNWTALFSQGGDIHTFDVVGSRLRCRSLRTSHQPHVVRGRRVVLHGDTAFRLTDGARDDLGPLRVVRTIQASHQDRWEWDLDGEPQRSRIVQTGRTRSSAAWRAEHGS